MSPDTATAPERSWWGAVLSAVLAAVVLVPAAAFLGSLASIAYTGCFLKCNGTEAADIPVAVGYATGALLMLAGVVLCGVAGLHRWRGRWAWVALAPVLATVLMMAFADALGIG